MKRSVRPVATLLSDGSAQLVRPRYFSKPRLSFAVPDCAEIYQETIIDKPDDTKKQIFLLASNNELYDEDAEQFPGHDRDGFQRSARHSIRLFVEYQSPHIGKKTTFVGSGIHLGRDKILSAGHNVEPVKKIAGFDYERGNIFWSDQVYADAGLLNARHTGKKLCHPISLKLDNQIGKASLLRVGSNKQDVWAYQFDVALLKADSEVDDLPIAKTLCHLLPAQQSTNQPPNLYMCGYPAYQSYERWVIEQYRGDENDLSETKAKAYNMVMMNAFFGGEKKIISRGHFLSTSSPGTYLAEHSASTLKGCSGGGLFDANHEFIGIHLGAMGMENVFLHVDHPLLQHVLSLV